jgi:NAD(P)-dependent dehydrogenase (short-subunit alcohol dehydrogenase family)
VCQEVLERPAGVAGLFANAGVSSRGAVADLPLSEWQRVLETHLSGTFHICQAVLAHMVGRRAGALVLMASDYAVVGMRNGAAYAAAKTGVYSLAKALAREFAPHGIRVNAVGPGPIDTPLLRGERSPDEWDVARRARAARVPLGRLGQPQDVASVVDFLLSDRAAYVTGQLVQPNGGQVMW